jgi:hypothetical protein
VRKKGEEKENGRERERMVVQEGKGREKKEKGKREGEWDTFPIWVVGRR